MRHYASFIMSAECDSMVHDTGWRQLNEDRSLLSLIDVMSGRDY